MKKKISALLVFAALMSGACTKSPFNVDVKPVHEPMYNFTQSSDVLACVGDFIDARELPPVDMYVANIPDHTTPTIEGGFLTKNAVMMVTTAVDRLGTPRVAVVGADGALPGRRQVQILGAFTELNRTIQSNALSGETVIPGGFEFELGRDNTINHIALDLALSEANRIVSGTATSVSIHIFGNGGDATLTYDEGDEFAIVGALGFTAQEGFHSASRLLVETAVAVMVARYYGLDVTDCFTRNKRSHARRQNTSFDAPVFDQGAETQSENVDDPPQETKRRSLTVHEAEALPSGQPKQGEAARVRQPFSQPSLRPSLAIRGDGYNVNDRASPPVIEADRETGTPRLMAIPGPNGSVRYIPAEN